MKKLFIIPVLLIFMTSASSNRIQPKAVLLLPERPALNTRIDSLNIKASELKILIQQ
jgi:hypothetical protein